MDVEPALAWLAVAGFPVARRSAVRRHPRQDRRHLSAPPTRSPGHSRPPGRNVLGFKPGIPVLGRRLRCALGCAGAGCKVGDVVNVVGTSTCIIATRAECRPDPRPVRHRAGQRRSSADGHRSRPFRHRRYLRCHCQARQHAASRNCPKAWSATAPGRRACCASPGTMATARCWCDPDLGGMTLGWNLPHTAQDELLRGDRGHRLPHPPHPRAHGARAACRSSASSMAAASRSTIPS